MKAMLGSLHTPPQKKAYVPSLEWLLESGGKPGLGPMFFVPSETLRAGTNGETPIQPVPQPSSTLARSREWAIVNRTSAVQRSSSQATTLHT